MATKASESFIQCLEVEGEEYIFGVPGVHLVDCPIDYSDNDRVLNKEIRQLSATL